MTEHFIFPETDEPTLFPCDDVGDPSRADAPAMEDMDDDALYDHWKVLSAIPVTIEQLERANASGRRETMSAFCRSAGFENPGLAAQAMSLRWSWVVDAQGSGVDLAQENPDLYRSLADGLIDPMWMGFEDEARARAEFNAEWSRRPFVQARNAGA